MNSLAQRISKITTEYTYYVPENITIEQAKQTALDRAKIQAIADEFGTIVTQRNTTFITNKNGNSNIDFQSIGGSDIKGEWIETIGHPIYKIKYLDNQLIIKVSVTGKIREITTEQIDLKVDVLCNGTTKQFENTNFKNGDDLFVRFQSPVDGYLAIYLLDIINETVYCLLPYQKSNENIQTIYKDKPYLFFCKDYASEGNNECIDEYIMTCSNREEQNDLYIIFSPNKFTKANSNLSDEILPRELKWKDFQKWMVQKRKRDKDMQVILKSLIIKG